MANEPSALDTQTRSALKDGHLVPLTDPSITTGNFAGAGGKSVHAELEEVGDFLLATVPTKVAGTSDTLAAADHRQTNWYTDASQVSVTLPADASVFSGFRCDLVAGGAGGITLVTTGRTIVGGANTTIQQGEAMTVIKTGDTDTWIVIGGSS